LKNKYHFKRKNLLKKIDEVLLGVSSNDINKGLLVSIFKDYMDEHEANIKQIFFDNKDGLLVGKLRSDLFDSVILTIFDILDKIKFPISNPTTADYLSIVAVGGYGRNNLSPGSDIDLLILTPYKITPRIEKIFETLLYMLWDLKIKVGYAVRSLEESISKSKIDNTICTSLLDARLIAGNQSLWLKFQDAFKKEIIFKEKHNFFTEKLKERRVRHLKMGDSSYLLEPNIKEGKGGIRDLNTLRWIIHFIYQVKDSNSYLNKNIMSKDEALLYDRSEKFLSRLRTMMHYCSNRNSDRLTFDLQVLIANKLGYKNHIGSSEVERLMKHYYLFAKDVGYLTASIIERIENDKFKKNKFKIKDFFLQLKKDKNGIFAFYDKKIHLIKNYSNISALNIFRAYNFSVEKDYQLSANLTNLIKQNLKKIDSYRNNIKANTFFINILMNKNNSEAVLRNMNETGVLGRFIPDFGKVVAQVQHDMYHTYTVDEHTINAIGILRKIYNGELAEKFPLASKVVKNVVSKKVLFVALFLHDIAKGRGGNHSILGGEVAKSLCPRFGMSADETETVVWLIENHLLLSQVAFKRDLDDINTILDLKTKIQSAELLRLLYVLTVADISAVGPEIWNNWKANLLKIVFNETLIAINGSGDEKSRQLREKQFKAKLYERLDGWNEKLFKKYSSRFYPYYWTNVSEDLHYRHAEIIKEADKNNLKLKVSANPLNDQGVTEVSIYTQDHSGLFARTCAGLALSGTSVQDARIVTSKDGMSINSFLVSAANPNAVISSRSRINVLIDNVSKTISEERDPKLLLNEFKNIQIPSRLDKIHIEPRVLIDNLTSRTHTLIEINSKDKIGLLYSLASELFLMGLQVSTARISTYGVRVVDVFYVQDMTGSKIVQENKINQIKDKLMNCLVYSEKTGISKNKHLEEA